MAEDLADRQEQRLSVKYGNGEIAFELVASDRATLEIAVLPDGSVVVEAPRQRSRDNMTTRVARPGQWILRQQRYFAQFQPRTPPRRCVGGWFRVTVVAPATPDHIRGLLDGWYREKAARLLDERLEACWRVFPPEGLTKPRVQLRRMNRRWGSLSGKGALSYRLRDRARALPSRARGPRARVLPPAGARASGLAAPPRGPMASGKGVPPFIFSHPPIWRGSACLQLPRAGHARAAQ